MLTLLDNLGMLQNKTDKSTFRERKSYLDKIHKRVFNVGCSDVLPLVYNALESDHAVVSSMFTCLS